MLVWRSWVHTKITKDIFGAVVKENHKIYKMLLLFGFIPLFISIDGK